MGYGCPAVQRTGWGSERTDPPEFSLPMSGGARVCPLCHTETLFPSLPGTSCGQRCLCKTSEALVIEMDLKFCIRRNFRNQTRCRPQPPGNQAITICILGNPANSQCCWLSFNWLTYSGVLRAAPGVGVSPSKYPELPLFQLSLHTMSCPHPPPLQL